MRNLEHAPFMLHLGAEEARVWRSLINTDAVPLILPHPQEQDERTGENLYRVDPTFLELWEIQKLVEYRSKSLGISEIDAALQLISDGILVPGTGAYIAIKAEEVPEILRRTA